MRVVIAGGRDQRLTADDIYRLDQLVQSLPITEVVTGGARGIDTDAHEWARSRMLPTKVINADWEKFGKSAGPIRNAQMARQSDVVVTFKGGRGTDNMKHTAVALGLKLIDYGKDERDTNEHEV